MEKLIDQFKSRLNSIDITFKRYLWKEVNWSNRLIAIVGARGVGKTTLLLQRIKENHKDLNEVLYVSLDNLYFGRKSLMELTSDFVKLGGKYLFLDEVHKYPNWSVEIKNIYDTYSELNIVITGSSALDIHKGKGDLSRRVIVYKLNGLSFREYLYFAEKETFKVFTLSDILDDTDRIAQKINEKIKPIKHFNNYLKTGYYPFFAEGEIEYYQRIQQVVNQIIENDLPAVEFIDYHSINKIKTLLMIISEIVPFKPNISKLAHQVGINRDTFVKYLYWLQKADLLLLLSSDAYGISKINKPEKVFLNNSNLMYALTDGNVNTGTLRETFFYNQLKVRHKVKYTDMGDFMIDNKYVFEIGGKNKSKKQIATLKNAYIAADNIEYPHHNTIPVWMFGFLY